MVDSNIGSFCRVRGKHKDGILLADTQSQPMRHTPTVLELNRKDTMAIRRLICSRANCNLVERERGGEMVHAMGPQ
jgi:hypothetical protein